jgi:leader peptidase (prepilin peptidase)/N-methyltransferase
MNAAAAAMLALAPALALGSFLNVVAVRVPAGRSVVRPPSSCGSCGREIRWRDNIPVLSYIVLRGHCRHCGVRISPVYPLVEALTAALVVGCVAAFGVIPYTALAIGFCAMLVILTVIDLQHEVAPNRLVLSAAAVTLVAHTAIDPSPAWALGALGASGVLLVVAFAYPKWLGLGNIAFAFVLGAMLGASASVALVVGLLAAVIPAAVRFARHGADVGKVAIPLMPFLAFGAAVALFFDEWLLGSYVSLS